MMTMTNCLVVSGKTLTEHTFPVAQHFPVHFVNGISTASNWFL